MATLNDQPINRAEINYGPRIWTAKVSLTSADTLPIGAAISLNLEGFVFTGYVLRGSSHLGVANYIISGGGGGWRLRIAPPELRSGGFIRLHTVIRQIESAANAAAASSSGIYRAESVTITEPDRILAKAWVTRSMSAAAALDATNLGWIVLPNGTTRVGPNPDGTVDAKQYAVQAHDPAHRWALLAPRSMADVIPIFDAIGGTISGDPFTRPFQYEHIKLLLEANTLRIEVEA